MAVTHAASPVQLVEVAKSVDKVVAAADADLPASPAVLSKLADPAATGGAHETGPAQVAEAVRPAAAASLPVEVTAAHATTADTPKAEVTTTSIVLATAHPALDASQAALPVTLAQGNAPRHFDTLEQLSPAMAAAHPLLTTDGLPSGTSHGIDVTTYPMQLVQHDLAFG
jgi:hypothetical protein